VQREVFAQKHAAHAAFAELVEDFELICQEEPAELPFEQKAGLEGREQPVAHQVSGEQLGGHVFLARLCQVGGELRGRKQAALLDDGEHVVNGHCAHASPSGAGFRVAGVSAQST